MVYGNVCIQYYPLLCVVACNTPLIYTYTHVLDVHLSSMHTDKAFKTKYDKAFRESCEGVTFVLEDA